MPSSGSISIVIRVRNEGPALRKVLCALKHQDVKPLEIVIVDNASTDDSRIAAEQHGAKIVDVPKGEFTYGKALNIGIGEGHKESLCICILSAHSLPIRARFLAQGERSFY